MADLVDVVVVGGGVLGTALTFALAKRNLRVALLEAQRLASGATGSGFAWVNATYKWEDEAYFALNAQGVAHYDRLAAEWGSERVGLHADGALFWASDTDAAGRERLRRQARQLQAWNYPAVLLTAGELAVLEPQLTPVASTAGTDDAILFAPADKWVDTARLCRFFGEQAQTHKAEIRLNSPALGFTRGPANRVSTVETPQGRIASPLVVIAAGLHAPALIAQLMGDPASARRLPLNPEPGLLVETPPLAREQRCGRILYPAEAGGGGLHLRPTPTGGMLIGAEDVDAWLNRPEQQALCVSGAVPEALWHSLLDRAAQFLPGLPLAELYAHSLPRICLRPVPSDGLPVIGALPDVPGAYIAVTHSGITLGPLLAELLAHEIVTHTLSPLLAPYRPARF